MKEQKNDRDDITNASTVFTYLLEEEEEEEEDDEAIAVPAKWCGLGTAGLGGTTLGEGRRASEARLLITPISV